MEVLLLAPSKLQLGVETKLKMGMKIHQVSKSNVQLEIII